MLITTIDRYVRRLMLLSLFWCGPISVWPVRFLPARRVLLRTVRAFTTSRRCL
jgi:hypothetical protein